MERSEDIVPLALSLLDRFNKEFNTQKTLTLAVCQVLSQYDFPGNVRELENLIRRLATMTKTDRIDLGHLPPLLAKIEQADHNPEVETSTYQDELAAFEQKKLKQAVEKYGSQRKAAKIIGISQSTLSRKLKKTVPPHFTQIISYQFSVFRRLAYGQLSVQPRVFVHPLNNKGW